MTEDLMSRYLVHERAFFRLAGEQGCPHSEGEVLESIDNPDQRIVSDVDSFTNAALNFTVVFLGAGLRVASFGKILYDISTHLAVCLHNVLIPPHMSDRVYMCVHAQVFPFCTVTLLAAIGSSSRSCMRWS